MSSPAGHDLDDGLISAFTGLSLTPETTPVPASPLPLEAMADTTGSTPAVHVATSNANSAANLAAATTTMAPRLYDRYPKWDGDFNSFDS
ncbi:hypothetical protein E4U31_006062 [Claviceps sp. LM219 group G6]|nr:hypothetical protein E4U31_006062 [Claviceps sp. LM219 group G6]